MELENISEENYFFRFSAYQKPLLELYAKNPEFVLPAKRMKEIKNFVEKGLEDFSISRLKEKMPWGVPVPNDENQVMYVWFDALVNYISTLGWPNDEEKFAKFWPGYQVCGKDNLRQQSAMWQAMLMSAKIANSKQVFVNGFITVGNQKMSKSLGNVISPYAMVEKFGTDATRYLLLSGANFGEDFDITWEKLTEKYNADLANGIGNLLSRVIKLSENYKDEIKEEWGLSISEDSFFKLIEEMEFDKALGYIMDYVRRRDRFINEREPWKLAKNDKIRFDEVMKEILDTSLSLVKITKPFMPETSEKIKKALETKQVEPLFQRIK
jgi:methionyl-tRNA synthetase